MTTPAKRIVERAKKHKREQKRARKATKTKPESDRVTSRPFMTSADLKTFRQGDTPIDPNDKTTQEVLRRYYHNDWGIDEITKSLIGGSAESNSRFGATNRRVTEKNPKYDAFKRYVMRVIQTVPKEAIQGNRQPSYIPPNCAPLRRFDPYAEGPCDE